VTFAHESRPFPEGHLQGLRPQKTVHGPNWQDYSPGTMLGGVLFYLGNVGVGDGYEKGRKVGSLAKYFT